MQLISLKSTRQLWEKTVDGSYSRRMRRLYSLVKEKPEWLSLEDNQICMRKN
jgi:hypothetical protein